MSVTHIELNRLLSGAERLCTCRNRSLPVELGKSLFEVYKGGVLFSQAHYLLDSSHSHYTNEIAYVTFDESLSCWLVMVPVGEQAECDSVNWGPYPYLPQSKDLDAILTEIEKDPKSYFWS
ncbi:DUF3024 domain-containing protein [Vibrio artabrorum]|uniref:DUF3024 domain-containing protein n=1 Tax=Vibrio artabrorum TaxID=446374 RepID=A0ABT8CPN4_9VIBR|nr:DUF3024 domain-containing protein [Vibrio artabrorum]MDN3702401.1 DUF3024 domain-containing protein [Vibrio artabrorum]